MSKKVDHPELRAQLAALNNKELHHKCVEYGMNVPVADSTREVIIRKLIKSINGDATAASPKANKKLPTTPSERRKTVNVTVHVSSDEDEAERHRQQPAIKNRTRTQSPKGHNVTFDTTATKKQKNAQRIDANANIGVGLGSTARIVPIAVEKDNAIDTDDYNIEVRRTDSGTILNKDVNFSHGPNFTERFNGATLHNKTTESSYNAAAPNLGFNQNHTLHSNYQQGLYETPLRGFKAAAPIFGFSQTRTLNTTYQQDEHSAARQGFISSPQEHTTNRPLGVYGAGAPATSFNSENMASHSSTIGGVSPTQEPFFKRPTALSKSNVSPTSYNQCDAQRLYPRLPTDLPTPPSYTSSPPSTPDSQQSTRSGRAPSLTKSGVMTTSYYQEISPVKEVKHYEVESGDEPAIEVLGDYDRSNTANTSANYERSSYLSGIQRGTEARLPFETQLQSTKRDSLYTTPRYTSSPVTRESYMSSATTPQATSSPTFKRYSTTAHANTSYTRSIDEPESASEGEQLSGDDICEQDSEEEEYLADSKKIYSSFGSNKIQERLPYRRSNTARLSASPQARYSQSAAARHSLHHPDDDDDDVNASLKNFFTTLDRKYHIKQMFYMFAIFVAAVFIYVMFFEKTPTDDDVLVASKVQP